MSEDQDIVKAVFVILSKLRTLEGGGEPLGVDGLIDLERALGVLAGLCEDEERSDVVEWARGIEKTRIEIESYSSDVRRRIRGLSTSLESGVIDILMKRLPEERREEVREKLAEILDDVKGPDLIEIRGSEDDRSSRSGLEDKLKMIEEDEPPQGLDRFIEGDETG
jgi:hypothetical protein